MKTKATCTMLWAFLLLTANVFTQVPQKFNYQAVVRDGAGNVLYDQTVGIKISILQGAIDGTVVYSETHSPTTNAYGLVTLEIGGGTTSNDFTAIDWGEDIYFMKVEMDATGGTSYSVIGTSQLLSVPYALNAEAVNDLKKLNIVGDVNAPLDSALFEVKRSDGQTVFAVYNEGVRVYVEESAVKGTKGGFAVGGFAPSKDLTYEYFRVTPDSVRIYLDDSGQKGTKGGFAVGGVAPGKGLTNEYLKVTSDSTRIYTADTISGFGVGNIGTEAIESYLKLTPQNYFIGHESGNSITTGLYNSFIGYNAGRSTSYGSSNDFIGYMSGYNNIGGMQNSFIGYKSGFNHQSGHANVFIGYMAGYNTIGDMDEFPWDPGGYSNVYIGNQAGYSNQFGYENTYIGTRAGMNNTDGHFNVFVGTQAGQHFVSGSFNTFLGQGTGYDANGEQNTFLGSGAGYKTLGHKNVFVGFYTGMWNDGEKNVFMGYYAGRNQKGSNKLVIENSDTDSTGMLIFGNFEDNLLRLNANVGIGRNGMINKLEVEGNASKTTAGDWLANSDIRIKTNIQDINDSFEKVLKLRPVAFKYSDDWKEKHPGIEDKIYYNFIAQEYQQVFPDAVQGSGEYITGDPDEMLQIDTYPAQVVTIKAVQDLILQNQEQQKMIEELKQEIAKLKNR